MGRIGNGQALVGSGAGFGFLPISVSECSWISSNFMRLGALRACSQKGDVVLQSVLEMPFRFYSPEQDIAFASMLERICELAAKRGLPVLLIGGHAVIAHGHPRNTFDIDFVIEVKDQRAWRALLEGLGYTLHAETRTFFQMQPSDEQTLPVDVMMVNKPTFAKMLALAKECSGLPPDARVVSLEHLLALKCHAIKHGHPGRVEKDVDDVLGLVRANQLDVTSSDWREIFLKYGPPELYEKLRNARQKPSPPS